MIINYDLSLKITCFFKMPDLLWDGYTDITYGTHRIAIKDVEGNILHPSSLDIATRV